MEELELSVEAMNSGPVHANLSLTSLSEEQFLMSANKAEYESIKQSVRFIDTKSGRNNDNSATW